MIRRFLVYAFCELIKGLEKWGDFMLGKDWVDLVNHSICKFEFDQFARLTSLNWISSLSGQVWIGLVCSVDKFEFDQFVRSTSLNSICLLSLKIELDQFSRSTSLNWISLRVQQVWIRSVCLVDKFEFDQFARLTSLNLISLRGWQVWIWSVCSVNKFEFD